MTIKQKRKIKILGKDNTSINIEMLDKPCLISDEGGKQESKLYEYCLNCNRKIIQKNRGRKRKYCSDKCSHNCYIKNKYWRKEDVEEIMSEILAGKKVESIPKWIKELLNL